MAAQLMTMSTGPKCSKHCCMPSPVGKSSCMTSRCHINGSKHMLSSHRLLCQGDGSCPQALRKHCSRGGGKGVPMGSKKGRQKGAEEAWQGKYVRRVDSTLIISNYCTCYVTLCGIMWEEVVCTGLPRKLAPSPQSLEVTCYGV